MIDDVSHGAQLDDLVISMSELTRALEAGDESDLFDAICAEAVRAVPGADLASVTAVHEHRAETIAHTDPRALEIDRRQYASGEGPCLEAADTGGIVRVSLGTAGRKWPQFTEAAQRHGIGSYLAAPLHVDENFSGALNLFGFGEHGFAEIDSQVLAVYTTVVTFGLRTTHRYRQARERAEQLDTAMRSRAVIEQAKGMLMAIHRIDSDQAMRRLVTESQHSNVKLRDVAQKFVDDTTAAPAE